MTLNEWWDKFADSSDAQNMSQKAWHASAKAERERLALWLGAQAQHHMDMGRLVFAGVLVSMAAKVREGAKK